MEGTPFYGESADDAEDELEAQRKRQSNLNSEGLGMFAVESGADDEPSALEAAWASTERPKEEEERPADPPESVPEVPADPEPAPVPQAERVERPAPVPLTEVEVFEQPEAAPAETPPVETPDAPPAETPPDSVESEPDAGPESQEPSIAAEQESPRSQESESDPDTQSGEDIQDVDSPFEFSQIESAETPSEPRVEQAVEEPVSTAESGPGSAAESEPDTGPESQEPYIAPEQTGESASDLEDETVRPDESAEREARPSDEGGELIVDHGPESDPGPDHTEAAPAEIPPVETPDAPPAETPSEPRVEQAVEEPGTTEESTPEPAAESEPDPSPEEEAGTDESGSPAPHTPLPAQETYTSEEAESSRSAEEHMRIESDPRGTFGGRNVETLSREELLEAAGHIEIDGNNLREIYETRLIGEHALRRLLYEYQSGGDLGEALRRELLEHQIDFERDPAMRDVPATAASPARTPGPMVQEPAIEPPAQEVIAGEGHEETGTLPQNDDAQAAYEAMKQSSPRPSGPSNTKTILDILFIAVIAILALLVLIVYLRRG